MRNKPELQLVLLVVLSLLLIGSCLATGGCSQKEKIEEPELGPLEPPFSEIIPSAEVLYIDLFFSPYHCDEETIYYPDSIIGYSRTFGNEAAFYSSLSDAPKPESPPILLSMIVYEYQDEEQALECVKRESENEWSDTEFYATLFNLPLEDITGSIRFWKEPEVEEVQGEEEIFFRIGRYVGNYQIYVEDPPELADGFFMPPELHYLLEFAVRSTMTELRSRSYPEESQEIQAE